MSNGIYKVRSLHMLKVFISASRLGSFTASSQHMNMTQSAVSQQIKRLEEIVGFELFYRRSRGVSLTGQGRLFLSQILPIFAQLTENEHQTELTKNKITISLPFNLAQHWVKVSLGQYKEMFGQIELSISDIKSTPIDQTIEQQRKERDLCLIKLPTEDAKYLSGQWKFCLHDTLVPVCSPKYITSKRILDTTNWVQGACLLDEVGTSLDENTTSWTDLFIENEYGFGSHFEKICFDSTALKLQAAREGFGVTLASTPEILPDLHAKRLIILPAKPVSSSYSYYIAKRELPQETSIDETKNERHMAINWLYESVRSLVAHDSSFTDPVCIECARLE